MIGKSIRGSLAMAALFLAIAACFKAAQTGHLISPDLAGHSTDIIIGLSLALYGNFIPKQPASSGQHQAILRASGWAFTLAGLTYALIWLVAPANLAFPIAITAVACATLLSATRTLRACQCRNQVSQ